MRNQRKMEFSTETVTESLARTANPLFEEEPLIDQQKICEHLSIVGFVDVLVFKDKVNPIN